MLNKSRRLPFFTFAVICKPNLTSVFPCGLYILLLNFRFECENRVNAHPIFWKYLTLNDPPGVFWHMCTVSAQLTGSGKFDMK
jgi:hypothetical protein